MSAHAPGMAHPLLVHGAWGGGWVWDDVAARLEDLAHRVTVVAGAYPGSAPKPEPPGATRTRPVVQAPTGAALLLAVFGIIAIIVGFQGLLTPDY